MKILQSFWSKPFRQPFSNDMYSRQNGGFPLKRHFIYTWSLSLLCLKQQFGKVHLITDDDGKKLLLDKFHLPYDSCSLELNCLKDFPSSFWAAGKIFLYTHVKEPFIHFDGDIIIGKQFEKKRLSGTLVSEFHYVDNSLNYRKPIRELAQSDLIFPPIITDLFKNPETIYEDYNMGIIGGTDYSFFNDYGKESLTSIKKILPIEIKDPRLLSFLNCLFEQRYFFKKCQRLHKNPALCIPHSLSEDYDYQKKIIEMGPDCFTFVHLHNTYKRLYYFISEKWLSRYFPDYYDHINVIIRQLQRQPHP